MHYMTAGVLMSLMFCNKNCLLENVTGNAETGWIIVKAKGVLNSIIKLTDTCECG